MSLILARSVPAATFQARRCTCSGARVGAAMAGTRALLAKKADKKGKDAGKAKVKVVGGDRDTSTLSAINVTKMGPYSEDFVMWEDDKYPDWLWELDKPEPTIEDLRKIIDDTPEIEDVDLEVLKRYLKLSSRQKIKRRNAMSRKK